MLEAGVAVSGASNTETASNSCMSVCSAVRVEAGTLSGGAGAEGASFTQHWHRMQAVQDCFCESFRVGTGEADRRGPSNTSIANVTTNHRAAARNVALALTLFLLQLLQ